MLADTEIWRQVAEKIAQLREDKTATMVAGGCLGYAEYQRDVGYLGALKDVEQAAHDVFARMTGTTDDDDRESVGNHYEE